MTDVRWTRRQYLDHEVSHDEYYGQFVTPQVEALLHSKRDRIARSTDPHFNDISLRWWDQISDSLPGETCRAICAANESGGLSLSDRVCVLKAAARKIREEAQQ
jgi:hypothetical protein